MIGRTTTRDQIVSSVAFSLGITGALVLIGVWLAWIYIPRTPLALLGIAGLAVFVALFRYPVLLPAMAAFIITSGLTVWLPGTLSSVLVAGLAICAIRQGLSKSAFVPINTFVIWAVIFHAWYLVSAIWVQNYQFTSLAPFYRDLLVVFVFLWLVRSQADWTLVVVAAGLGMVLTAGSVISGYIDFLRAGASEVMTYGGDLSKARFFGHWLDPNIMGLTLVPFIGFNIIVFRSNAPRLLRTVGLISAVIGTIPVALSLSRSAMVCLAIMLVVIAFASKRKWLALGSIALLGGVVLYVLPIDVIARIQTLLTGTRDASVSQRGELFVTGFLLAYQSFPLGIGTGGFQVLSSDYVFSLMHGAIPHSTVAEVVSESGVLGSLLFMGVLISVYAAIRSRSGEPVGPDDLRSRNIEFLAVFVAIVCGLVFLSMSGYAPYWAVMTLISIKPSLYSVRPGSAAAPK